MSVTPDYCDTVEIGSTPGRASEKRLEAGSRVRDYVIFALCAAIYILPFMRLYLLGTDEGTLDYGAVRVVQGQVFTRDFFEVIGPGTFYQLALFFKLFGISFLSSRLCLFIVSMGTALLMYFLSQRICRSYKLVPVVFLAGTYFGGVWPTISHHVDSNFYALLAVACAVMWSDRRSTSLLFAAGAVAGVTTVFLQPKGALLFLALLVWQWTMHRRGMASLAQFATVVGAYCLVILAVLLYFWSQGALHSLIHVNFIWPLNHYQTVNSVPYASDLLQAFRNHHVKGMLWTIPMAALVVMPIAFVAALPGLLPILGARFRWNVARPDVLLYWLCGAAMWLSEIHRKDTGHLVFGSPLLMILCVHFLTERRGRIENVIVQVLAISTVSLCAFNLFSLLLAAHRVETPRGSVRMFNEDPVFTFLRQHVSPGEEIFSYPYCPRYYFLAATTNPTPYSVMLYNYNTPSQFQEVVKILEQRRVKYVVWDRSIERFKADVFPAAIYSPPGGLIIEPYLKAHYQTVKVFDSAYILQRKD